jgi:hypothetical protein
MKPHHLLMAALAAVLLLLLPTIAIRAEDSLRQETGRRGYGEAREKLQIPEKLPELWKLVLEKQAALSQIIRAKELDKVHEMAFQIRDLVQSVPGKSGGLSTDNLRKLNESVEQVESTTKLIVEYAGGWEQAKVEEQAVRLGELLARISNLYPAGSLGSGRAAAGPHGGAVVTSGAYRLELMAARGGLSLFVMDPASRTVSIDKMSAMAMAGPKAETHVALEAAGDHFAGRLVVPKTGAIRVTVMVASVSQDLVGYFVVSDQGVVEEERAGEGRVAEAGLAYGRGR